jgi:hypothetical protein
LYRTSFPATNAIHFVELLEALHTETVQLSKRSSSIQLYIGRSLK